jgi:aspartate kinase
MIVYKFGGTSISGAKKINLVTRIIKAEKKDKVVVCSALDGVTERLLEITNYASKGKEDEVKTTIERIELSHQKILSEAVRRKELRDMALEEIKKKIDVLRAVSLACAMMREVTPKERDLILSTGELISGPIMNASLQEKDVDSVFLSGGEAGIVTDDNFGDALPIFEMTYHNLRKKILPLLSSGKTPVVSGYTAVTQYGDISTLGRGGSDYTATLIGAAIGAEEVVIWSDVDGLMTADPKIVKEANVIDEVTYSEAREMAMFGAKSMHPRCLDPAEQFGIIVRFKNTFNPDKKGTTVKKDVLRKGPVTAVCLIRDVSALTVTGTSMVGKPGSAASIFSNVAKTGTNIMMISQSVSESNISFVVRSANARKVARMLENTMVSSGEIASVSVEEGISVVAVIGENMKGTPGIAARIFRALGDAGINVKMIAQGSSEMNISFVVDERDSKKAVRAIHRSFGLGVRNPVKM